MPRRCALAAVLSALILAAPAAAQTPPPAPAGGPSAYHGTRITGPNPAQQPQNAAVPYTGPQLALRPTTIPDHGGEPMIAVDKTGYAMMSGAKLEWDPAGLTGVGYGSIYQSADGGNNWTKIMNPSQFNFDPARDFDPYVYVDRETGRFYEVVLELAGSILSWSDDQGKSWRTSAIGATGANDHQTIVTAEPPEAAPAIRPTYERFPKILYYCVNAVTSAECSRSTDGGETFQPTLGKPFLVGGPNFDNGTCYTPIHGHLQSDSAGRIFIPTGNCGAQVAISEDGGDSWERVKVSEHIHSADRHTAMAVDRADNLYFVWWDPQHRMPYLSTSTDHGKTWSAPLMVAPPGVREVNFPQIDVGDPGRVALTFPGSTVERPKGEDPEDTTRPWDSYVVVTTNALDANPLFVSNIANPANDPVHRGNCGPGRCGNAFDFLDIMVSPHDGSVWATAADTCTDLDACRKDRETGKPSDDEGVAIRQVGGPWMVAASDPNGPGGVAGPNTSPVTSPLTDRRRPALKRLRIRAAKRRAVASFRLSEAATVTFTIRRGKKRVAVARAAGLRGANRVRLPRRLKAGRYAVTAAARDAAGNRSRAVRRALRVR